MQSNETAGDDLCQNACTQIAWIFSLYYPIELIQTIFKKFAFHA